MRWKLMAFGTIGVFMLLQGWRGAHADEDTPSNVDPQYGTPLVQSEKKSREPAESPEMPPPAEVEKSEPEEARVEAPAPEQKNLDPVPVEAAPAAPAAEAPAESVSAREPDVKVFLPQKGLDKNKMRRLIRGVYEVVIPKQEDKFVVYERPLPVEKLPFKERSDKYIGIGTAFSITPGKFVSAAHVFGVENKSLFKEYYLRNSDGKVFRINQFLRYSAYRDAVEFNVVGAENPEEKQALSEVLPYNKKTELGDTVYTVGNAFGDGIAVRGGQIASFTPEDYEGAWKEIRYSAPASPGNSGGPLINEEGQVVGIVVKKNGSENLNYALPIDELFKLSTAKSEFYVKQDQASYDELVVSKDWKFASNLPASILEISKEAEESRRQFRIALYDEFFKKFESELFPGNDRVKVYLREQAFSNFLSSIERNQQKNWYLDQPKYGETLLSENQKLFLGYTKSGSAFFLLERPKEVALADFVQNSQLIHETFLKAIKWNRSYGGEKILISSYGKAQESRWERDKLGRPWNISIWRTTFNDRMHVLACTPLPKGVNCTYDFVANSAETLGFHTLQRLNRDELMFSYGANLPYWKDYLALGQQFLPSSFTEGKMEIYSGKGVEVKLAGYQLLYKYPELSDVSYLQVDAGFGVKSAFKHQVFSMRILNRFDRTEGVGVWAKLNPLPLNSEEYKRDWQDLEARKGPYSGKPLDERGMKIVRHVLQKADEGAGRGLASSDSSQPNPTFVLSCFEQSDNEKQDLAKKCLKWAQVPLAPGH